MAEKKETFANRLKFILNYRKLSQAELAKKLNIDRSSVTKYINGENHTTNSRLHDIALLLNVNPAWLLGYDVPMENTNLNSNNKIEINISKDYFDLDYKTQNKIIEKIEEYAELLVIKNRKEK